MKLWLLVKAVIQDYSSRAYMYTILGIEQWFSKVGAASTELRVAKGFQDVKKMNLMVNLTQYLQEKQNNCRLTSN